MTDNHERLDDLMKARRFELGMRTWRALAERAGVSYETLRAVRAGGNPGDATENGLEGALKWGPGSIRAILAGGMPILINSGRRSALSDSAQGSDELTVEREGGNESLAKQLAERLRWFEEDNERRRQEDEKRMRQLEDEVKRLKDQRSG